ncbi:MAG: DUF4286 family protein [Candidatus Pedobacter colombiensis]|uniref:DUF4286 family protein n=1 Tax=Candidatus Pedobacter colombiensis TaxID=3121371 RepID=A0AAJ5W6I2_9SPHI|nr:DUF4286 family protein [Pedobacter sp.]WEK19011.1 MAG: DUF4286 family protein [Pedobacter sp.]
MLLYNVTTIIEDAAADSWLKWMEDTHIPNVMASGKFVSYRLLRVLDSPNEGVTYCAQYVVDHMADYLDYQETFAPKLQAEANGLFENKFVSFQTLMEYIA